MQIHYIFFNHSMVIYPSSASDEDTQRANVRVDQCQVERRQIQIGVCDSNEHRLIDRRIALVHFIWRLPRPSLVGSCHFKWGVGGVDL